jgi:hypothetical protein
MGADATDPAHGRPDRPCLRPCATAKAPVEANELVLNQHKPRSRRFADATTTARRGTSGERPSRLRVRPPLLIAGDLDRASFERPCPFGWRHPVSHASTRPRLRSRNVSRPGRARRRRGSARRASTRS